MSDLLPEHIPSPSLTDIVKTQLASKHDFNPEILESLEAIKQCGKLIPENSVTEYALAVLTEQIEQVRKDLAAMRNLYRNSKSKGNVKRKEWTEYLQHSTQVTSRLVDYLGIQSRLSAMLSNPRRVVSGNMSWSPQETVPAKNLVQINVTGNAQIAADPDPPGGAESAAP